MSANNKVEFAKAKLKAYVAEIDILIKSTWRDKKESLANHEIYQNNKKIQKIEDNIIEHIIEHNTRQAKRLRAALIYYTYKLFGWKLDKQSDEEIKKASISIERVHTWLLVHDDFQDRDIIRRWQPTTHKYYEKFAEENLLPEDAKHFGEAMAINVWDLALTLWYQQLLNSNFDINNKIASMNYLFDGISKTAMWQSYDLILENSKEVVFDDIYALHHGKTGIYTYQTPMMIWYTLAGGKDPEIIKLISEYATNCGIAFQLQDDVLWVFWDSEKTGKSTNSDLKEWKKTLLILHSLQNADVSDLRTINKYFGHHSMTDEQADEIKQIIKKTWSLEHSFQQAKIFSDKAVLAINKLSSKFELDAEALDFMEWIAIYMWMERDY